MAQEVEGLPGKHELLSSTPVPPPKNFLKIVSLFDIYSFDL
jgi:hypothetical protein